MTDLFTEPVIAWIVSAIVVTALVVKVFPFLRRIVETIESLEHLREVDVKALAAKVDTIHHEVTPNDGSSIKDALKRVEQSQAEQGRDLGGIRQEQRIQRQELADQSERINGMAARLSHHIDGTPE